MSDQKEQLIESLAKLEKKEQELSNAFQVLQVIRLSPSAKMSDLELDFEHRIKDFLLLRHAAALQEKTKQISKESAQLRQEVDELFDE